MIGHGYSRSSYYTCVYHRKPSDGSFIYLLLYVDDMLIAAKDMVEIDRLKAPLSSEFYMKNLGAVKKILEMKIETSEREDCFYLRRNTSRRCLRDLACLMLSHRRLHLLLIFSFLQSCYPRLSRKRDTCLTFSILVQLGISCMLWCALVLIFHMPLVWWIAECIIWKGSLAGSKMDSSVFERDSRYWFDVYSDGEKSCELAGYSNLRVIWIVKDLWLIICSVFQVMPLVGKLLLPLIVALSMTKVEYMTLT